jgi:lipid A 3-O-deacylase
MLHFEEGLNFFPRNRMYFRALAVTLLFVAPLASGQLIDEVSIYVTGGKGITTWHGQADLQTLNLELGKMWSPRTDVAVVLSPLNVWQPQSWFGDSRGEGNEAVRAVSASVLVRRRFGSGTAKAQWYADVATGPMMAEKRVPAATSRFNFITQGGFGAIIGPSRRFPVYLGYRFAHISNGGYSERNPGWNISSLVVGTRVPVSR